jgi:hypothetical protein
MELRIVVRMLGDRAFTGEPNVTVPSDHDEAQARRQMQDRTRVENAFGEFEAAMHACSEKWRHDRALQPPTILLATSLCNFKRKQRMMSALNILNL